MKEEEEVKGQQANTNTVFVMGQQNKQKMAHQTPPKRAFGGRVGDGTE
jgi:hypothetical protein